MPVRGPNGRNEGERSMRRPQVRCLSLPDAQSQGRTRLVAGAAAANARAAAENVGKCALLLEGCEFHGAKSRVQGLGFGDRPY